MTPASNATPKTTVYGRAIMIIANIKEVGPRFSALSSVDLIGLVVVRGGNVSMDYAAVSLLAHYYPSVCTSIDVGYRYQQVAARRCSVPDERPI